MKKWRYSSLQVVVITKSRQCSTAPSQKSTRKILHFIKIIWLYQHVLIRYQQLLYFPQRVNRWPWSFLGWFLFSELGSKDEAHPGGYISKELNVTWNCSNLFHNVYVQIVYCNVLLCVLGGINLLRSWAFIF